MGYRSEVQCLIYGTPAQIDAMVMKWKMLGGLDLWSPNAFGDAITEYTVEREAHAACDGPLRVISFYGDDWKWYSDYPDVAAWEAFMRTAPDFGACYEFVRVGEDDNDNEHEAGAADLSGFEIEGATQLEYWLGISRRIYSNAPVPA